MAGHDPSRFTEVMDWPLRDLMLGYVDRMKDQARRAYELELVVWALLAPHQRRKTSPPDVPAVLKG